ncbi:zf-HC2 domain-containing protein [bacterium]|nr:zf-HC2 domain-containing protein [bacterium]
MRCKKAKKLISEYIDGRLDSDQKAFLRTHIRECPECQKWVEDLEKMSEETKNLAKLSPSPQSWWKIQKKMREERESQAPLRTSQRKGWAHIFSPSAQRNVLAAALLLVIVVGAALIGLNYWKGHGAISSVNQTESWAKLKEAERHYRLAIKALQEAVMAQKKDFNPHLVHVYQQNLKLINQSIQACKQAVQENPEDMEARHYLLAAYRQKVDFLNEMIGVTGPSSSEKAIQNLI